MTSAASADRCPRCGGGFACGMGGSAPCPCTTVTLDDATLAALRARFTGCLCLACLQALAGGAPLEMPRQSLRTTTLPTE